MTVPNLIELLCDAGLAILLAVTIGYCARLSRRIRTMQDTRGELAGMITQFDQSTGRAMATLAELQSVSKRITDALQLKIEKANFLADDLAFLIEKSSKLATQLETHAKAARAEPPAPPKPAVEAQPFLSATAAPAKPRPASWPPAQPQGDLPPSVKSAASLEALLSRLGAPAGFSSPPKAAASTPRQAAPARTDAERELLQALKSGR